MNFSASSEKSRGPVFFDQNEQACCCSSDTSERECFQEKSKDQLDEKSCRKSDGEELEQQSFVEAFIDTPVGFVPKISSRMNLLDLLGRWAMRWGIGRNRYRVAPGLYAVGAPDVASPVLVTANYKMTFDILRRDIAGLDAWIMVLETYGINVWCAAGKGTFGTCELVERIKKVRLSEIVTSRKIILPQLGAPGVAAHKVKEQTGFSVVYGPVRSIDIKEFLTNGLKASSRMRLVEFSTMDRLVLTPVELSITLGKGSVWAIFLLIALSGFRSGGYSFFTAFWRGLGAIGVCSVGVVGGAIVTPVFLPWLPWRAFSAKGAFVGLLLALILISATFSSHGSFELLALLFAVPAVASYCAMNFTGATPFTSPSGVEKEMRKALPLQIIGAILAACFWVASAFVGL